MIRLKSERLSSPVIEWHMLSTMRCLLPPIVSKYTMWSRISSASWSFTAYPTPSERCKWKLGKASEPE